jgi:drug/metabolite transporter (DMT)-like permease
VSSVSASAPVSRLPATAEGTSSAAFGTYEWGLVGAVSLVWGASYLLIADGLETLEPGVVAWLRIVCGLAVLWCLPRARNTPIARSDWPRVVLIGVIWFAIPMTMFPIAEQWVSSSVAGMLNGALPIVAATIAAVLLRRPPGVMQTVGVVVGFGGVVLISLPSLQGGSRTALGVLLVLVAIVSYGFAGNLVVPLSHRYGSIAVIPRALAVALVLTTPYAAVGTPDSSLAVRSVGAVLLLGAVGTGMAFVLAATVLARVGATRGSVMAYLIPVVALVLGVVVKDDHVEAIAVVGLGVVLVGAWLTSRAGR